MKKRVFCADFETTVYEDQDRTDVWAWAIVEEYTEEVKIDNNISSFMVFLNNLNADAEVYFHNLKFDGHFILDYLLKTPTYKDSFDYESRKFKGSKDLEKMEYNYNISNMGVWYNLSFRNRKGKLISFFDSFKLIPFSLRDAGKAFNTKHQKLEMEYEGHRFPGWLITPEEREYIKNDVLVLKECLEYLHNEGFTKKTVGSCCLDYYKHHMGAYEWDDLFCNLYELQLDSTTYGHENAGEYIRRSYRGGWCYITPEAKGKVWENGRTYDANGLYSSVMHSMSGNEYPFGYPTFWRGGIPPQAVGKGRYYFVRFRCRFYLKDGFLPFIQIKGNSLYKGTEHLTTSDALVNGKYYKYLQDKNGIRIDTKPELVMTCTDFERMFKHYRVEELDILDGCFFSASSGMFDSYINHFQEIKANSKGAKRTLAKLYLNNLCGQMAKNNDSSFKHAYLKNDRVRFENYLEFEKDPAYIAVGAAITSYAKDTTIRVCQANYHPGTSETFLYADTDSAHMTVPPERVKGFVEHDKNLCCWKKESEWEKGWFVRQKTYIETVGGENSITCAGLPKILKDEINENIKQGKMRLEDFDTTFEIYGKLRPVTIPGGVTFEKTTFSLR